MQIRQNVKKYSFATLLLLFLSACGGQSNTNEKVDISFNITNELNTTKEENSTEVEKYFYIENSEEDFVQYYANESLEQSNSTMTKVIVVIHGVERNALEYYTMIKSLVTTQSTLEDTMIIAPHFKEASDVAQSKELQWSDGGGWKVGSLSIVKENSSQISSFTVLDQILTRLSDKEKFPNIKEIVLTGHSAGGTFTQRYAVTSALEIENLRYVIANPSSYVYLDNRRINERDVLSIPDDTCLFYNDYKYGLNDPYRYFSELSKKELRYQYAKRDVIYLLGVEDTQKDTYMDSGCEANLQGEHRYERGLNYWNYMNDMNTLSEEEGFDANHTHRIFEVLEVGHSKTDMYYFKNEKNALFTPETIVSDTQNQEGDSPIETFIPNNSECTKTLVVGESIQDAIDQAKSGDTICLSEGIYSEEIMIRDFVGDLVIRGLISPDRKKPSQSGGAIISGKNLKNISNGLIDIADSSNITISGLVIEDAVIGNEEIGINIENSQNIIIENNLIQRMHSSGVGAWSKVGGRGNPSGGSQNIIIRHNTIIDVNDKGGNEKISVAGVDGFLVYSNEIYNLKLDIETFAGGEGIDIKQGSRNGKVYDNYIHDLNSTKSDKPPCIYVDAFNYDTYNIEIFNNIVHDCGATGIMISDEVGDAGTLENILVYNNLIFDNDGDAIAGNPDRNAIDISATNADNGVKSIRNIMVFNNTIYNSSGGILIKDQSITASSFENISIFNNVISGNTGDYNIGTKNLQTLANEDITSIKVYRNLYEEELLTIDKWGGGYHSYAWSTTDENGNSIETKERNALMLNPLVNPQNNHFLADNFKLKSDALGENYGLYKSEIMAIFTQFSYIQSKNTSVHIDNNPATFISTPLNIAGLVSEPFSSRFDKDIVGNIREEALAIDVGAFESDN